MFRSLCRFGAAAAVAAVLVNGCGDPKDNGKPNAPGEEGVALCSDGKDNDGDTMLDCNDPDCAVLSACARGGDDGGLGAPGTEETLAACQDGKDNDGDGSIDCADTSCAGLVICVGGKDGGANDCDCDDGLTCTADTCNATTKACGHTVKPKSCVIEGACYAEGAKNGSACQVCDPAAPTAWTSIVGGCQIGGLCYRKGEKDATGCQVCDPVRSATSWSAVTTPGCIVAGRCYADGEKDPTGCDVCNVTVSTTALQDAKAACTIGGRCYEEGAKHPHLTCGNVTCNSFVSTTAWTVLDDECLIGDQCYPANSKRSDGCASCVPSQSKTSWTSSTYACNIGGSCYAEGAKHPSGSCGGTVCESAKSTSSWTIQSPECLIANRCYQAGDKTSNGCLECNPILSKTTWSNVTSGCNILGSCYGNGAAHPSPSCKTTTCNTAASASSWTIAGNECLINGQCYAAGDKAPGSCQECIPSTSKTAWTPSPLSCVINGTCYTNGAVNTDQSCTFLGVSCDGSKSTTQWTITGNGCVINDKCYANGALDPTGCAKCDTAVSKTSWTPQATCNNIVLAALNGAYTGNLGGIAGANSSCATQAAGAGYGGTWKAFLSSSAQNVVSLVTGTSATSLPVVNIKGEPLFANWNAMFNAGSSSMWSTYYLYAFNGKSVTSGNATPATPDWQDADGWVGSLASGMVRTGYTCNDWTDGTINYSGANTELDLRYLVNGETHACNYTAAVPCVRVP